MAKAKLTNYQKRFDYIQEDRKKELDKKKHFSCNNCECCSKAIFKNKVIFCAGLIKKTSPKCDKYRFCIIKNKNKNATDIMLEELMAIITNLSTTYLKYLSKKSKKKNG
jgi:hypothetical protein